MLAADLAVSELEEDRNVRAQLGVRGEAIDRSSEQSAPQNFERDVIAVDD